MTAVWFLWFWRSAIGQETCDYEAGRGNLVRKQMAKMLAEIFTLRMRP